MRQMEPGFLKDCIRGYAPNKSTDGLFVSKKIKFDFCKPQVLWSLSIGVGVMLSDVYIN